jgi:hypothetical protein
LAASNRAACRAFSFLSRDSCCHTCHAGQGWKVGQLSGWLSGGRELPLLPALPGERAAGWLAGCKVMSSREQQRQHSLIPPPPTHTSFLLPLPPLHPAPPLPPPSLPSPSPTSFLQSSAFCASAAAFLKAMSALRSEGLPEYSRTSSGSSHSGSRSPARRQGARGARGLGAARCLCRRGAAAAAWQRRLELAVACTAIWGRAASCEAHRCVSLQRGLCRLQSPPPGQVLTAGGSRLAEADCRLPLTKLQAAAKAALCTPRTARPRPTHQLACCCCRPWRATGQAPSSQPPAWTAQWPAPAAPPQPWPCGRPGPPPWRGVRAPPWPPRRPLRLPALVCVGRGVGAWSEAFGTGSSSACNACLTATNPRPGNRSWHWHWPEGAASRTAGPRQQPMRPWRKRPGSTPRPWSAQRPTPTPRARVRPGRPPLLRPRRAVASWRPWPPPCRRLGRRAWPERGAGAGRGVGRVAAGGAEAVARQVAAKAQTCAVGSTIQARSLS